MRGMMKLASAVAALALVAAPLAAQAGQGRGPGHDRGPAMGRGMMQGGPGAMVRNPAAVVLEHRDALELTAEQVRTLERVQARIETENGPRWEQIQAAFGDADPAELTVAERQALRDRMRELQPVRDAIRETNRTAMDEVHALLTDEQETALRGIMRRGP
jgi:Spy/CpxP family protein refolding chaperone